MTVYASHASWWDDPPAWALGLKACDCAHCGRVLLGDMALRLFGERVGWAELRRRDRPEALAGRFGDRPYCGPCLAWVTSPASRRPQGTPPAGHYGPTRGETNPGWDDVVKAAEDQTFPGEG